jgi:hypothetical protein
VFGNLYLTDKAEPYTAEDESWSRRWRRGGRRHLLARLRQRLSDLALAEDRERIARDLHDAVIQDLFAVGLSLQATTVQLEDESIRRRGWMTRWTASTPRSPACGHSSSTCGRWERSTPPASHPRRHAGSDRRRKGHVVEVHLSDRIGEVDSPLLDNAVLVIREAVSNAMRHGGATELTSASNVSTMEPVWSSRTTAAGFDPERASRGMGIANMEARATDDGGSFDIESTSAGTTVRPSSDGGAADLDQVDQTLEKVPHRRLGQPMDRHPVEKCPDRSHRRCVDAAELDVGGVPDRREHQFGIHVWEQVGGPDGPPSDGNATEFEPTTGTPMANSTGTDTPCTRTDRQLLAAPVGGVGEEPSPIRSGDARCTMSIGSGIDMKSLTIMSCLLCGKASSAPVVRVEPAVSVASGVLDDQRGDHPEHALFAFDVVEDVAVPHPHPRIFGMRITVYRSPGAMLMVSAQ